MKSLIHGYRCVPSFVHLFICLILHSLLPGGKLYGQVLEKMSVQIDAINKVSNNIHVSLKVMLFSGTWPDWFNYIRDGLLCIN